jgi:hypothetical protein
VGRDGQRTKYDPRGVVIALSALGESRRGRPGMACRRRSDMVLSVDVGLRLDGFDEGRRHRSRQGSDLHRGHVTWPVGCLGALGDVNCCFCSIWAFCDHQLAAGS